MADAREHPLSLAFMRTHPAQAARVLESLPAAETGALFARAPARDSAAVLSAMLPRRAARCIAALDDERALELLAPMGTQPTVALLRHLPEPRRSSLVAGLPTTASLASSLLLGYTEDTLGAWADPDVVQLQSDARAGDAVERMRLAPSAHALVFVADAERRLAGVVALTTLLQAPTSARLSSLMKRPAAVLTAHAPLAGSAAHPGWELASVLPVVEPGERLVGVMTRDALARALRRAAPPSAAAGADAPLPVLAGRAYWQLLSGLFEAGLALLPRVPPVMPPLAPLVVPVAPTAAHAADPSDGR